MNYFAFPKQLQCAFHGYVQEVENRMGDVRVVSAVLLGVALCTMTLCISMLLSIRDLRRSALFTITNQGSAYQRVDAAQDVHSLFRDQDPGLPLRKLPRCLLR
tara:strand:+ start:1363 stop:1671 length:309 start_codon:yes stop_codon:yes gene_type:complete